ncbi:LanC-like protein, partial [Drosera capensis]
ATLLIYFHLSHYLPHSPSLRRNSSRTLNRRRLSTGENVRPLLPQHHARHRRRRRRLADESPLHGLRFPLRILTTTSIQHQGNHEVFDEIPEWQVVAEMWAAPKGGRVREFEVYSGVLGTALLGLKSYLVTGNEKDLELCGKIVRACDACICCTFKGMRRIWSCVARSLELVMLASAAHSRNLVTFICGRAGVCALGAVVAKYAGNDELLRYYLTQFRKIQLPKSLPDELLYGRAGYLWACLYINKHIGPETIPSSSMRMVVAEIIENGRRMPNKGRWPLMYEWYGERYWGAAHGLAGIMHVLMECNLTAAERQDVMSTLGCMIQNRFPSGNYPASEEDRRRDLLVHWCHGAPGIALTLIKAYEVFKEKAYLEAAVEAAEVVWNRGLLKRVGICHGISGNTYVFLSLYRATGNMIYLHRAKAFAFFLLDRAHKLIANGEMHGGDHPYSLFEGIGGMAYLFLDMVEPLHARFPAYEL